MQNIQRTFSWIDLRQFVDFEVYNGANSFSVVYRDQAVDSKMTDSVFKFNNSYADQLQGFYAAISGDKAPSPRVVKLNHELGEELGLDLTQLSADDLANIFSASVAPKGAAMLAQVYAGHQFGSFNPQLGDGRALLLGEVIDRFGRRRDIHFKGSGRTPFSRGGDGKAVLGPVLREYIMGEAMHALGVPTTRALAAVTTGEQVMRDSLLPGAVLTRVGASHIRVGTFEFFAARNEYAKVKQLADYAIRRHYPSLQEDGNPYLGLLAEVCDRQAALIAKWMHVGFVHGVMNTDNMTISGETIDYGPCAFMESYDLATVFSSIDRLGRYAYGNQPSIAQWNLARLAEALLPLIDDNADKGVELATDEIKKFSDRYERYWLTGMRKKIGLLTTGDGDLELTKDLLISMEGQGVDFTLLFRHLASSLELGIQTVKSLFQDSQKFEDWHARWLQRLAREPMLVRDRIAAMNCVNPLYIPRNHKVEEAIQSAEREMDYSLFEKLLTVLGKPFELREGLNEYAEAAPNGLPRYKTFCGT